VFVKAARRLRLPRHDGAGCEAHRASKTFEILQTQFIAAVIKRQRGRAANAATEFSSTRERRDNDYFSLGTG
jgi:hypothetical protein